MFVCLHMDILLSAIHSYWGIWEPQEALQSLLLCSQLASIEHLCFLSEFITGMNNHSFVVNSRIIIAIRLFSNSWLKMEYILIYFHTLRTALIINAYHKHCIIKCTDLHDSVVQDHAWASIIQKTSNCRRYRNDRDIHYLLILLVLYTGTSMISYATTKVSTKSWHAQIFIFLNR